MATFRNTKGVKTGFVPDVGEIVDGLLLNAPDDFENAAFEKVEEQPSQPTPTAPPASAAPATPTAPTQAPLANEQPLNKEAA